MLDCTLPSVREFGEMLAKSYQGWVSDRAPRLGASLAFYTLLSLAPMLVVVVAVASMVYGERAAQGRLVWEIQGLVGRQGGLAIQELLRSARSQHGSIAATIAGVIALFFGASGVVVELRDALNTIWKVPAPAGRTRWMMIVNMLKDRAVSFCIVLGIGLLLMALLVVNTWIAMVGSYLGGFAKAQWLMNWSYDLISFLVIAILFAVMYKLLPDTPIAWTDVAVGAALTSVLFTVGRVVIGMYLGRAALMSTYGAAGSLVVVLVWVYYSAQIFFFGAEFTCVYAHCHGSIFRRKLELKPARPEIQVARPDSAPVNAEPVLIIPESFEERKRRTA